jgi:VanZ family protein
MSSPIHDVPEALVLVPLLAVSLAVMLWRLHRGRRFTWPRAIAGAVACAYAAGVLKEVLQPFQIGFGGYQLGWRAFVHLTPLAGAEPGDLLDNVLLFLPLGVFLALLARVPSAWRATLTGFGLSLIVETTQLVLDVTVSPGRVADVDDLLGNTIGAAAGYAFFRLCGHVAPLGRLNNAMTWPAPNRVADQGDRANAHRARLDHHPDHR